MPDPLAAALEQIHRAFGKGAGPWPANDASEACDELSAEEQAAEDERQARWNAMSKEEQDNAWAEWEAEHAPNGLPF